jgi:hypothetical protein
MVEIEEDYKEVETMVLITEEINSNLQVTLKFKLQLCSSEDFHTIQLGIAFRPILIKSEKSPLSGL